MISLALCALSAQAQWVLLEEGANSSPRLLASIAWEDENSRSLSDALREKLEILLNDEGLTLSQIHQIYVFIGPGAFTALRMSVSFAMGLARALRTPLISVPTFALFDHSVWIPTRHQLARSMSFQECVDGKMEFLEVYSETQSRLSQPLNPNQTLGTLQRPNWPSVEEITHAVKKFNLRGVPSQKIHIQYGLNPKISGQRHPI